LLLTPVREDENLSRTSSWPNVAAARQSAANQVLAVQECGGLPTAATGGTDYKNSLKYFHKKYHFKE
jgi:hypothetical protein